VVFDDAPDQSKWPQRRLRVCLAGRRGEPTSAESAFVKLAGGSARYGNSDALIAVVQRRRREWLDRDYMGLFDSRVWALGGHTSSELGTMLGASDQQADVYVLGVRSAQTICRFMASVHPTGESIARRVLHTCLRLPERLLTRRIPAMGSTLWLARPHLIERYVNDWLVPARRALEARRDSGPDSVCLALLGSRARKCTKRRRWVESERLPSSR
jgi:hypothetical protein